MKNKALWVSFIAIFAIALALNSVIAATSNIASLGEVRINGIVAQESRTIVAGQVSDTIPVEVEFVANQDVSDVKVHVYIEGYKDEISAYTPRFQIVNGSEYVKRFALKLPSSIDLDDLHERAILYVEITAKGEDSVEGEYFFELQKDLYSLNILSVDAPEKVTVGNTIAIDTVVENNGYTRLDNVYVKVSIPELGVERKVYFGDLAAKEDSSYEESYDNIRDTQNKVLYLTIPSAAKAGVYNLQVEAYNYDTSVTAKKQIAVEGMRTGIVPSVTSRTVAVGEKTTFNLVLVNPNDKMVVYTLSPEQTPGLTVEVEEPVVTVAPDSSRTVKVNVMPTSSAEAGTHTVKVNVVTESGLERTADFTVNVQKQASGVTGVTGESNTVLILTVVLVIIFVVLLIVLIVLLTKKPAETEEFGETSYY